MNRRHGPGWLHLLLVAGLALHFAVPAHAARANFECDVASVRQHAGGPNNPGRFEIRCRKPYANSIEYFTLSSSVASPPDVAQMAAMVLAHVSNTVYFERDFSTLYKHHRAGIHSRVTKLQIEFDDADTTTGPAYGCLATDCRNILAVSLVPVDWSWSY